MEAARGGGWVARGLTGLLKTKDAKVVFNFRDIGVLIYV
jgi:hypothetical protein